MFEFFILILGVISLFAGIFGLKMTKYVTVTELARNSLNSTAGGSGLVRVHGRKYPISSSSPQDCKKSVEEYDKFLKFFRNLLLK